MEWFVDGNADKEAASLVDHSMERIEMLEMA
jgi:hypothetical protein